eukprot:1361495-Amorphochlora_amoeboformis.AAC.1
MSQKASSHRKKLLDEGVKDETYPRKVRYTDERDGRTTSKLAPNPRSAEKIFVFDIWISNTINNYPLVFIGHGRLRHA